MRRVMRRLGRVFPTRVGMVRCPSVSAKFPKSFPHPRGDGPRRVFASLAWSKFSPPAWGWSEGTCWRDCQTSVFPTRVGMVHPQSSPQRPQTSFPHPRGDGPRMAVPYDPAMQFSPPAWGWSALASVCAAVGKVFPTRVGMVRLSPATCSPCGCFPHPRGDGPVVTIRSNGWNGFSPPAWGWSANESSKTWMDWVFPTRVGMVRQFVRESAICSCFPHPRGDGPLWLIMKKGGAEFSPPAWGWSGLTLADPAYAGVFPTRVGMVRLSLSVPTAGMGFPHPRGDGPISFWRRPSP